MWNYLWKRLVSSPSLILLRILLRLHSSAGEVLEELSNSTPRSSVQTLQPPRWCSSHPMLLFPDTLSSSHVKFYTLDFIAFRFLFFLSFSLWYPYPLKFSSSSLLEQLPQSQLHVSPPHFVSSESSSRSAFAPKCHFRILRHPLDLFMYICSFASNLACLKSNSSSQQTVLSNFFQVTKFSQY